MVMRCVFFCASQSVKLFFFVTTQKRKKTREFLLFGVKIDDPFLSGGVGSFKVFGVCPLSLATSYNIKDEEEEEGKKDSEDFLSLF